KKGERVLFAGARVGQRARASGDQGPNRGGLPRVQGVLAPREGGPDESVQEIVPGAGAGRQLAGDDASIVGPGTLARAAACAARLGGRHEANARRRMLFGRREVEVPGEA